MVFYVFCNTASFTKESRYRMLSGDALGPADKMFSVYNYDRALQLNYVYGYRG